MLLTKKASNSRSINKLKNLVQAKQYRRKQARILSQIFLQIMFLHKKEEKKHCAEMVNHREKSGKRARNNNSNNNNNNNSNDFNNVQLTSCQCRDNQCGDEAKQLR